MAKIIVKDGELSSSAGINIPGSLSISGNVTIGDNFTNTLTVNSISTFNDDLTVLDILSGTISRFTTITSSRAQFTNDIVINNIILGRGGGAVSSNIALGSSSLAINVDGFSNVAIGPSVLSVNTGGDRNIGIGDRALRDTTASDNIAIGSLAGVKISTGARNVVIGSNTFESSTTATDNTSLGYRTLQQNTTGPGNTAIGSSALLLNTTGGYNTVIGHNAGSSLRTGSYNVFIGASAGSTETNLSNTVIISTNTERIRINSTGVGIATTNPAQTLDISGTLRIRSLVAGTNNSIGRSADGDITAATSDMRLKKDITTITGALNSISQIRGVKFKWDNSVDQEFIISTDEQNKNQIGLIAQEVEQIFPELVYLNGIKDYKSVRYAELVSVLIEAVKELKQENQNLKIRLEVLENS